MYDLITMAGCSWAEAGEIPYDEAILIRCLRSARNLAESDDHSRLRAEALKKSQPAK